MINLVMRGTLSGFRLESLQRRGTMNNCMSPKNQTAIGFARLAAIARQTNIATLVFVYVAQLHFTQKRSPQYLQVSLALYFKGVSVKGLICVFLTMIVISGCVSKRPINLNEMSRIGVYASVTDKTNNNIWDENTARADKQMDILVNVD